MESTKCRSPQIDRDSFGPGGGPAEGFEPWQDDRPVVLHREPKPGMPMDENMGFDLKLVDTELLLEDLLADPIILMVMAADGVSINDVVAAVRQAAVTPAKSSR